MSTSIESVLGEDRLFEPSAEFAAAASVRGAEGYEALYRRAEDDPDGYWSEVASELHWFSSWNSVCEWNPPDARWFDGGTTNLAYNCLDRHLESRPDKAAIIWEGEPGDQETLSFLELHTEVCRAANALLQLGVKSGDRVAIYLPMILEAPIAMLACARIGAVHSVVFAGFSADSLRDRILDAGVKVVITADGGYRRGKVLALKNCVDEACKGTEVERVLCVKRCENEVSWTEGRDHWWHEVVDEAEPEHEALPLDAEHPLFLLYTSGTTGKPKGILHTTGGYMVGAYQSTKLVFDVKESDVFWCTADVGWITGHSYSLYGALLNGTTTLMFEGAPNHPGPDRFWEIVASHRVSIFYTAPTAVRAFMKWGDEWPAKHDLSSLRLLGSVGEPINPEAWMWYRRVIGKDRCPVVDTWWQTETGSIMVAPLPGAVATKPGSCTKPLPGVSVKIVDSEGREQPKGEGGFLVIDRPWPSMLRTIYGDHKRFLQTYFEEVPGGMYFAGDGARIDADGYVWIMGRVDDVINVSGHRLSTMEVESALVSHDAVAESAVVARADELRGQAIVAFVTLMEGVEEGDERVNELKGHVAKAIGALARPAEIRFAKALPKTRSGKIMRRLLRDVAEGKVTEGDMSTLEDSALIEALLKNS